MVGRRSFPFGARPILRAELLVLGRVLVNEVLSDAGLFQKNTPNNAKATTRWAPYQV